MRVIGSVGFHQSPPPAAKSDASPIDSFNSEFTITSAGVFSGRLRSLELMILKQGDWEGRGAVLLCRTPSSSHVIFSSFNNQVHSNDRNKRSSHLHINSLFIDVIHL